MWNEDSVDFMQSLLFDPPALLCYNLGVIKLSLFKSAALRTPHFSAKLAPELCWRATT